MEETTRLIPTTTTRKSEEGSRRAYYIFISLSLVCLIGYIVNDVSSTLFYKRELNVLIKYPFILAQTNYFITFIAWHIGHFVYVIRDRRNHVVKKTSSPRPIHYLNIAICNVMSTCLNILGSNGMGPKSGSLMVILSQFTIPLSVILSFIVLKRRYKLIQIIAIFVIFVGCVICLVPNILNLNKDVNNGVYVLVYLSSTIPTVCERLYQQYMLINHDLNVFTLGTYSRLYELLLNVLVLLPIYYLLDGNEISSLFGRGILDYLSRSFMAVYDNLPLILIFNTFSFIWLVNGLIMIKYTGDANLTFFGNAMAFPLCALIFAIPFIGWLVPPNMRSKLTVYQYVSVAVLTVGLILYCIGLAQKPSSNTEEEQQQEKSRVTINGEEEA